MPPDSTYVLLPLADFHVFPFLGINCNHRDNSSPWVLWVRANDGKWGRFGGAPHTHNGCQKWGWSDVDYPPTPALPSLQLAKLSQGDKARIQNFSLSFLNGQPMSPAPFPSHKLRRRAQSYTEFSRLRRNKILICLNMRLNCLRKFVTGWRLVGEGGGFGVLLGTMLKSAPFWRKE